MPYKDNPLNCQGCTGPLHAHGVARTQVRAKLTCSPRHLREGVPCRRRRRAAAAGVPSSIQQLAQAQLRDGHLLRRRYLQLGVWLVPEPYKAKANTSLLRTACLSTCRQEPMLGL